MIFPNTGIINEPGDHLVIIEKTSVIEKDFQPPDVNPTLNILGTATKHILCEAIVVENSNDLGKIIDFDIPAADVTSSRTLIGKLAKEIAPDLTLDDISVLQRKPFVLTLERNKHGRLKPKKFQAAVLEGRKYRTP